ncbi:cytochrome P450 [Tanacetum coccineum]
MNVASININRVGTAPKKEMVRNICRDNHVHFIGIQESKTTKEETSLIHSLWGNTNCGFVTKNSVGSSGGILAIWNDAMFKKHSAIVNEDGFIAIYGEWVNFGMPCLMIIVYAPQDMNAKCALWNSLVDLIRNFQDMCIVLGDFNEVRYATERIGLTFCKKGADFFNSFIYNAELIDLPMGGRRFTRMNKFATKLNKLDRILVSRQFTFKWKNAQLITLPRDVSDHCPLLLKSHSDNFGPIPFKFFNSWLLNDEFPTVFSQSWSSSLMSSATTHPAIILKEKLQHLKKHIRMWRSNATSNSDNLIQDLKDKVEVLDAKAENGCLVNHEIETRISLLKQLEDHNHIKRLDLMQKAKIKWAIDGDENSKFFHGFINSKISRSRINRILFNGVWVTDPPLVMSHIFNFHKNKFANNIPNLPRFTSNKFKTLSTDDLSLLDAPFMS